MPAESLHTCSIGAQTFRTWLYFLHCTNIGSTFDETWLPDKQYFSPPSFPISLYHLSHINLYMSANSVPSLFSATVLRQRKVLFHSVLTLAPLNSENLLVVMIYIQELYSGAHSSCCVVAGAAVGLLPRLWVWRGCMPVAQWVDSRALKCVLGLAHLLVILMIW